MKHILFVCNQGKNRSKTAADLLKGNKNVEAKSCGIGELSIHPISLKLLAWADLIVVMDKFVEEALRKKYGAACEAKRIINFNIPDMYDYMTKELVRILKEKIKRNGI